MARLAALLQLVLLQLAALHALHQNVDAGCGAAAGFGFNLIQSCNKSAKG
jgi:hypothetical protein